MPVSRRFSLGSAVCRFAISVAPVAAAIRTVDTRLASPHTAWAAGYLVNLTTDPGDGTCTLRDAIGQANASAGADTITFSGSVTATIVLGSALPAITDTLTIDGSGQTVTVGGANAFRVFTATAPPTLTALTVQHGSAVGSGGGAYFGSTAMISGVVFISNTASIYGGGAYFNASAVVTGTGAAAFVNPAAGDFHLTALSAAIDVDASTGLSVDFEGDPRPLGVAPDLGADELSYRLSLPLIVR